jgi:hypothetical protein
MKYDVNTAIQNLLSNPNAPGNADLINSIKMEMIDSVPVKMLVGEIAMDASSLRKSPTDVIGVALMFGMVLGVQLEKERVRVA